MNLSDRAAFLSDISEIEPEKFVSAWAAIAPTIEEKERALLHQRFFT